MFDKHNVWQVTLAHAAKAGRHRLQAAAGGLEADCDVRCSQDRQSGQAIAGRLTMQNPFSS
jgi:hypothetical protein